jgi:lysophospholipase L1-like esterase
LVVDMGEGICWAITPRVLRVVGFALFVASASPSCAATPSDESASVDNGSVTGAPVDCSQAEVLGLGSPATGTPSPKLVGRYDMTNPTGPKFDWSGNAISARFEGTEVSVGIVVPDGQKNDVVFEAAVDDLSPIKFTVTGARASYRLASGLPAGVHEVTVMRSSEAFFGTTIYTGFNLGSHGMFLPPTEHPRKIELVGDSMTCGYESLYFSYGSITARTLSADATTLCFSGKGIVLNDSETPGDADAKTTIPQYYERTLATQAESAWSFADPEPQVVVLNAGTSDFLRDIVDLDAFYNRYLAFVQFVRARRPNAHIFLVVSPMLTDQFPRANARSSMRDALNHVVATMASAGDEKVYRIELANMNRRYEPPNLEVHRMMANQLVSAIRAVTCW